MLFNIFRYQQPHSRDFATDNPKNSETCQLQQTIQNKVKGKVVGLFFVSVSQFGTPEHRMSQVISNKSSTCEKRITKWLLKSISYLKNGEHFSNYRLQQNIPWEWNLVNVAIEQIKVRDNTWPETVNNTSESTYSTETDSGWNGKLSCVLGVCGSNTGQNTMCPGIVVLLGQSEHMAGGTTYSLPCPGSGLNGSAFEFP